ncbi:MAG: hypothetical protein JNM89_11045 [Hyphomicrobiaceae bacterium]|nr:hypothetical protein [Hyphomicrobiaceae bacterium]
MVSPVARSHAGFSAPQIGGLALVLLVITSTPLWTHVLPPQSDYVNHLARMHIIARLNSDALLSKYYEIEWQIIPNLMMDLVVPFIERWTSVYFAGQLFTFLTFVLIVGGVLALNRSLFGRWSPLPLLCLPFLYNHIFLLGLMNYLFGVGLSIIALSAYVVLRERWLARLAVSTAFVLLLFFCHLFAVGIYGMGVLALEIEHALAKRERWPRVLRNLIVSGLPFLVCVPLLLMSPTRQLASEFWWEPQGKFTGLAYAIETYSDTIAAVLVGSIGAAAIWLRGTNLLKVHPFGWVFLAIAAIVYLAMPRVLFASYIADQRLPIAILFILLATFQVKLHPRRVRRGFIALLLLLVAVRVIEVDVAWSELSTTSSQFKSSVRRMKPGAKVLVAYGDRTGGSEAVDLGLVHAACLAIIERGALVTTVFAVSGKQVLRIRPDYRDRVDTLDGTPPSIHEVLLSAEEWNRPEPAYWRDWRRNFDYLYVIFTDPDDPDPAPNYLTPVFAGDRFKLYQIIKPPEQRSGPQ